MNTRISKAPEFEKPVVEDPSQEPLPALLGVACTALALVGLARDAASLRPFVSWVDCMG